MCENSLFTSLLQQAAKLCDHHHAQRFAKRAIPAFACIPDAFPAMIAAVIRSDNPCQWAAARNIVTGSQSH